MVNFAIPAQRASICSLVELRVPGISADRPVETVPLRHLVNIGMPWTRGRTPVSRRVVRTPSFHSTINSDSDVIHERVFCDLSRGKVQCVQASELSGAASRDRERGMKNEGVHSVDVHRQMRPAEQETSDSWMIENTPKNEPHAPTLNVRRSQPIDIYLSLKRTNMCFQPFGSGRRLTLIYSDLALSAELVPRAAPARGNERR